MHLSHEAVNIECKEWIFCVRMGVVVQALHYTSGYTESLIKDAKDAHTRIAE